jgi:hypothetical protein
LIGDAEGGERATGHENLFPSLHDLDELGRVGVQIHPVAGLLRGLRAGVHGHGHVGLCEGWGIIGTVAGHRYQPSARLVLADEFELRLRRGLGEEVIDQLAEAHMREDLAIFDFELTKNECDAVTALL